MIEHMSTTPVAPFKQHVTITAGVCGGKPCVAGTRIRVYDIASLAQSGNSPDEILTHYSSLTLADVHAALAYYYDNRDEIEKAAAEDALRRGLLREQAAPARLSRSCLSSSSCRSSPRVVSPRRNEWAN